MKSAPNNEMHGTPQGYLSFLVAGWAVASVDVKSRSTGARDLNAVLRLRHQGRPD